MARFIITETRIVAYTAVVEAATAEEARDGWLDCTATIVSENSEIEDSHGLTVRKER